MFFKGRGQRNIDANWRDGGRRSGNRASVATFYSDNDESDDGVGGGGAPLRTPVQAGASVGGAPLMSPNVTQGQTTVDSDPDDDSDGSAPATARKIGDKVKYKGKYEAVNTHENDAHVDVSSPHNGNSNVHTESAFASFIPATHHRHDVQNKSFVAPLNSSHMINNKVTHMDEGQSKAEFEVLHFASNTQTQLNLHSGPVDATNVSTPSNRLNYRPTILPPRAAVTGRSQLSPVAETFVPRTSPSQDQDENTQVHDKTHDATATYKMLMQKLQEKYPNKKEPTSEQPEAARGGSIPRSRSFYDGLSSFVNRVSSPQRASQVTRSMMNNSASMGSGIIGDQAHAGSGSLRPSRTEPINDPHSVAAVLNEDSAYESSVTTPHDVHQQTYGSKDSTPRNAHQQMPSLVGLAYNPASYETGASTQALNSVRGPYSQTGMNNMDSNSHPAYYSQVSRQIHAPTAPTPVPSASQLRPGEFNAIAQTWAPRPQDLPPLRFLNAPPEKLFQLPTEEELATRSYQLNDLVGRFGQPTLIAMLDPHTVPFTENCTLMIRNKTAGVLKFKNCPFNVSRNELAAIFGQQGKLLNDNEEPIHIILEKVTAKTQDAYAEFETEEDAQRAYYRIQDNISRGRIPRIGTRLISIECSSQSALMQELFPVAHGVTWDNATPVVCTSSPFPMDNFKCFISEEECTQICRHFECPGRAPFSRDCPERFIESMISTLKKLPWHMSDHITIHQQAYIYDACQRLMETLLEELNPDIQERKADRHKRAGLERLTPQILRRFTNAIMLCPGFTVLQKDNIASMVNMSERDMSNFNMPRNAQSWNHMYALGPKPGVPVDVLEYYISVLRQESNRSVANMPIYLKRRLAELADTTNNTHFGYFWRELNWPQGEAMDSMTLHEAAMREWSAIDHVIRRALANGPDQADDGPDRRGDSDNRPQPLQVAGPSHAGLLTY